MESHFPIRILSTRALSNASRDILNRYGWWVDMVPFIETHGIVSADQISLLLRQINNAEKESVLLFSSENGVRWLKWGLDKFGFHFPPEKRAVCVGEKTMKVAIQSLQVVPVFNESNSTKLVQTLKDRYPADQSFVFICGSQRLETIPSGLREAGFKVLEQVVYETILTPHKINRDYDAVLFFSPSAVESFFKVNTLNPGMVAVSIGKTTTGALKNNGVRVIAEAEVPAESGMLSALHAYLQKRDQTSI